MSDDNKETLKYKSLITIAGFIIAGGAFTFGLLNSASGQTQTKIFDAAAVEKAKLAEAQAQQSSAQSTQADTKANAVSTSSQSTAQLRQPVTHVVSKPVFTPMLAPKTELQRRALPPSQVQWQGALASRDKMKSARSKDSLAMRLPKKELDRTRLPVVIPREGGVIDTGKAKLMSFGDAYAMDLPQPKGAHFAVYGNRSFVKGDRGAITAKPFAKVQGVVENVQISRMEDGWTATFSRFGVVYSLDMMCDDIYSADCATDAPIRKAIADLTDVTMGSEAEAEAMQSLAPVAKPNWFEQTVDGVKKSVNGLMGG